MVNKNDPKDIEKLLGEKMQELADTVDCFDKIADRAFPQAGIKDNENWFTVTGLENVTVRSKRTKRLKWAALAAAAAVAIMVIPKTGILPELLSHTGRNSQGVFESVLAEISDSTASGDFITFDVPLSYYISNDVLITPLLPCPFEANDKEDALVRLYIRVIDSYPTNEVYALEYTGSFTGSGIIAAAYTDTKFIQADIDKIEFADRIVPELKSREISQAVENSFYDAGKGNLALHGTQAVSLASFTFIQHIKTDDNLYPLAATDVIYYHNDARFNEEHFYDTYTYSATVNGNNEIEDLPEREFSWKTSVYKSGKSAFPDNNASSFTRTQIFGAEPDTDIEQKGWAAVTPIGEDTELPEVYGNKLSLEYCRPFKMGTFSTVLSPAQYCTAGFRMYFSPYKDLNLYSNNAKSVSISCGSSEIYSAALDAPYYSEAEHLPEFSDSFLAYYNEAAALRLEDTVSLIANIQSQIERNKEEIRKLRKKQDKTEEDSEKIAQYELQNNNLENEISYLEKQIKILQSISEGTDDGREGRISSFHIDEDGTVRFGVGGGMTTE